MKRIIIFMTLTLLLVGCTNNQTKTENLFKGDATTQEDNVKKVGIALVMKTLTNPFFNEMERGARMAEKEFGINLIVKTGAKETSIQQQIAIVDDLIIDKIDAIVIAPGSSTDLIPVLKKAQDAGIVIINIDNRLDTKLCKSFHLENVPFISVDNRIAAYNSAKFIAGKIFASTSALIIEGIRGTDNGDSRKEGAKKAFLENKNIKKIYYETANWKIDEANTVTSKIFTEHPNIGLIFCANDMMALGSIQFLQKNRFENVLVASFDNLKEAQTAIKQGSLQATIDQKPALQGYKGIVYAIKKLRGEKVPLITTIETKLITR